MAKKVTSPVKSAVKAKTTRTTPATPVASTPVRNTSIPPKATSPAPKAITHDMIAVRAYEIHLSGRGGSEAENWLRAERELRA